MLTKEREKSYTVSYISSLTGLSLSHISQLIKRGVIPEGKKIGRSRYLPSSVLKIIQGHAHNQHWAK